MASDILERANATLEDPDPTCGWTGTMIDLIAEVERLRSGVDGLNEEVILSRQEIVVKNAQIDALKDKLAEERAKILMAGEDEVAEAWEYLKDNPSFINDAYQQLKADPDLQKAGVVWDE